MAAHEKKPGGTGNFSLGYQGDLNELYQSRHKAHYLWLGMSRVERELLHQRLALSARWF